MSTPTFVETYNLVAFLEKPVESARFKKIIDFPKSKPIHYALTVNPTIYVSCVKQFWATVKVKMVNDQEQIQALVDKKKVIITEENIRSDLCFDDVEGTACLLNEAIFEGLARMRYEKPLQKLTLYKAYFPPMEVLDTHHLQCLSAKTTTWNEFSSTMASAIISLADNQKFNFSNYIFDNMVKSLEGGVKFYLFLRFLQVFLDKQVEGMARHKEMYIISSHIKKIFYQYEENRIRLFWGRRVKPPMKKVSLGAQKDASKQRRMIEEINQNAEIALDDETQGRTNDDEMFGVNDLVGEEVVMGTTTGELEEKIIEDVSTAELFTTAGEVVTTTTTVKDSAAPTTDITKDEIIMAQVLAALKSIKPKVVVQEQEMSTIIPAAAATVTTAVPTRRAKAKMIELEVPIKKKDQMRIDEEYARKLEAEEQEAARLSRAQQDEEAKNSWDNIQDMMDANRLLVERLQAKEREEFSEVQKARLLVELIEKRKKHFAALRAQEKRNKPPTKTQMKSQICTYLKHMGGYTQSYLKGRSFDEFKKLFDIEMRKVNDFIAMDSEAQESSTKRTAKHLESDISKKQKIDKNVEPVIDDSEELKNVRIMLKTVKNQSKQGNIGHEIESLHQKPNQRAFFYNNQANEAKCQKIESSRAILAKSPKSNSKEIVEIKVKG
nr:hypothetical protein [Tanacetum cinerariifolium]